MRYIRSGNSRPALDSLRKGSRENDTEYCTPYEGMVDQTYGFHGT